MNHAVGRMAMVRGQIEARGIKDPRVLEAMRQVPRHRFAPPGLQELAYADAPLPLGQGATLSQPFIVAFMAEALLLKGGEKVLEVGSGSGYLLAVLSHLAGEVHGVEREEALVQSSSRLLHELGNPAQVHGGDGRMGLPTEAPFDAIVLSCAAEELPLGLLDQLKEGGRMVMPLGPAHGHQELLRLTKLGEGLKEERLMGVAFVPLR